MIEYIITETKIERSIFLLKLSKKFPENYLTSGVNFLYFGDKHYQFKKPANRTDDFSETEKNKVKQVRKIAKEHNVRVILQPGDLLDKPTLPNNFVEAILEEWGFSAYKKAREDYEAGILSKDEMTEAILDYIPIVGTVGNHEIFGGSLKTLPKTTLGFLSSIGFVNLVDKDTVFTVKTSGGRTVAISGLPYDLNLLKDEKNFILQEKKGDTDIFLVHEALYNTTLGPEINWLPIDKVYKDTKADVTIAGHIHHGFGWIEKDGKIFGNPGALAQQSSSVAELDRDIYVSLIHVSEDGEVFVRDIKLDSPRSRDIFDLTQKDEKINLENQSKAVAKIIDQIKPIGDGLATSIIADVAAIDSVPKEVTELAVETTREVENRIRQTEPLSEDVDYRIRRIELVNFEAHQHTVINIDKDNVPYVFIGESSNGKSSIARALYFFFENEGNSLSFVRKGIKNTECKVILHRADGLVASRFVNVKKTRTGKQKIVDQGWHISYPDGTETTTNTQGLETIQHLFGFNYLFLDEKDKIGINFRKQKEGDFFLNLKGQQRAKVIGALFGTQYILGAIKDLEKNRRGFASERKVVSSDLQKIEEKLEPLNLLDQEQFVIDTLETRFDKMKVKNTILRSASVFMYKQKTIVEQELLLSKLLEKKPIVNSLVDYYEKLEVLVRKQNSAESIQTKLIKTRMVLSKLKIYLEEKNKVNSSIDSFSLLEAKVKDSNKIKNTNNNLIKVNQNLNNIKLIISKKEELVRISDGYEDLKDSFEKLGNLKNVYKEMKKNNNSLINVSKIISVIKESSNENEQLFADLERKNSNLEKTVSLSKKLTEIIAELKLLSEKILFMKTELSERESKLKELEKQYSSVEIAGVVLYGLKRIGGEMTETELKELGKAVAEQKELMIRSESTQESLIKNKEELESQLRELGVDPDNVEEEVKKLEEEVEALKNNITTNLADVKAVAEKLKE